MSKEKGKKKSRKAVLLIILVLVLITAAVVIITNVTYRYDPSWSDKALSDGEKGVLTLQYCGADGKPESEGVTYSRLEKITLPKLAKKGYHFSGWTIDNIFVGTELKLNAKKATAKAQFDKDYTAVNAECAVYTDGSDFTEYKVGEYSSVGVKATDMFVDGGYKVTVFSKENFAGKETKVYYSGMFSGFVGSMKVETLKSESVELTSLSDNEKISLLKKFAPRIWWDENEKFFASTVEDADDNMDITLLPYGNAYYIKEVNSPNFMNDFLYGNLNNAKAYAFATEKEFKYLDLSYFVFMPYNQGKTIAGLEFGNHVGDWEHICVRLLKEKKDGKIICRPVLVEYSAHFMRNYYSWDEVEKVEGTHPVGYTACGSHGMWKDGGTHIYVNAVVVKLKDYCSQGTAWDLWRDGKIETYSYNALTHQGKALGTSEWKNEFDLNYCDENGGITIWGNVAWSPPIQVYARFDSAPDGPQHKMVLDDYYTMNDKKINNN